PGSITGATHFAGYDRHRPAVIPALAGRRTRTTRSWRKEGTMFRSRLQAGLAHVGQALREPEAFALRWHRERAPYAWWVFAALALTAVVGTLSYGLTLGILGGPRRM